MVTSEHIVEGHREETSSTSGDVVRGARRPIKRVERVVMGELAPGPRARLTDRLHALWSEYFIGQDRDAFARTHLLDNTHVVMTLGPGGDLAGFAYVNRTVQEVGGRRTLILGGGTFNRLDYRGSAALSLASFAEVARIRARHPRMPTMGVSVATNPIIFDLVVRMIACAAPRADYEPPPEALTVVHASARARNLAIDPVDPWAIQFYARSAQVDRILRSRAYACRTPAMDWFERRVPDWTTGRALLVWTPLSVENIARSSLRLAQYRREHG